MINLPREDARMQIRLSPDLDAQTQSVRAEMTLDEFLARFPEVPRDLRDEPVLAAVFLSVRSSGRGGVRAP